MDSDLPKQLRDHADRIDELSTGQVAHVQQETCKQWSDAMRRAADSLENTATDKATTYRQLDSAAEMHNAVMEFWAQIYRV